MSRVLLALLLAALAQAGEALAPQAWFARLAEIDRLLAAGDGTAAQAAADQLGGRSVAWPDGPGTADPGLGAAIRAGETARARQLLANLRRDGGQPGAEAAVLDRQRLAGLESERRSRVLAAGGEIGGLPDIDVDEVPWLQRMRERLAGWIESIADWFRRLFSGRSDAGGGMGGAIWAWIAAGVAIALLAAVAIAAMRRRDPPVAARPAAALSGADEALAMAAEAWFGEAARLHAAGDQRAAVRACYLGLLAAAWERGLLHHRTGWTNWDYVRSLPRGWAGATVFGDLTRRFDRVWYGGHPDPEGAEGYVAAARGLAAIMRRPEAR